MPSKADTLRAYAKWMETWAPLTAKEHQEDKDGDREDKGETQVGEMAH